MKREAGFSHCGKYRYWLSREWERGKEKIIFIGLNPSTADAEIDDPTIIRCIGFAKGWGYGGLYMLNIFALKSTDPKVLQADGVHDPVGPGNHEAFADIVDRAEKSLFDIKDPIAVCAWGNDGTYMLQGETAIAWLHQLAAETKCLGITKSDQPRHPLYLRRDTVLQDYPL